MVFSLLIWSLIGLIVYIIFFANNDERTEPRMDDIAPSIQTNWILDKPQHRSSWVPYRYHTLDPETHACLTCGDFPDWETRLDHLMRTAYRPDTQT